ncbi:hypothetical protein LCGC14_1752190, partial [marine sediment metagenome]
MTMFSGVENERLAAATARQRCPGSGQNVGLTGK